MLVATLAKPSGRVNSRCCLPLFFSMCGGGGQPAFGVICVKFAYDRLRHSLAIFFLAQLQFHGQLEFVAFVLKSIEDLPVHQSAVGFAEVGGINAV